MSEASQGEVKMARDSMNEGDISGNETERYRQAAEDALQQLDWCIGYLHGIRKSQLSAQLAKNRMQIKQKLMQEPTSQLPSATTRET
ncbi:MAG TPA: hypothetical protein VHR37_02315 [Solirubrobacterales bacterium]|nr:hypothetical protein [Solirubrobacterales bacterium]